eukprot:TRINITY_DN10122_c0_g2_i1.p1 TRINITY_DN10122_c0_g2~~TRINITY_DN10122_c0_g2_i1.p1  ORF type:complete len:354 (-),score=36.37 TRINITY_DN10122_c0_g2_i1:142-1203(-)
MPLHGERFATSSRPSRSARAGPPGRCGKFIIDAFFLFPICFTCAAYALSLFLQILITNLSVDRVGQAVYFIAIVLVIPATGASVIGVTLGVPIWLSVDKAYPGKGFWVLDLPILAYLHIVFNAALQATILWLIFFGMPQLWRFELVPPLRHVGVCEASTWKSSPAGIYFKDGSLERPGEPLARSVVDIVHCHSKDANNGHLKIWEPCQLSFQPVFASDRADAATCALAVLPDTFAAPKTHVACVSGGGVCGSAVNPDSLVEREGQKELVEALANFTGTSHESLLLPFLRLDDPEHLRWELRHLMGVFLGVAFIAVPFPLLLSRCLTNCRGAEARELTCGDPTLQLPFAADIST